MCEATIAQTPLFCVFVSPIELTHMQPNSLHKLSHRFVARSAQLPAFFPSRTHTLLYYCITITIIIIIITITITIT